MPLHYPVNVSAPLNRNHPLARGLELWWLAYPQWARSYTWRDISGKQNDGTLTNIDLSTTTCGWFARPHASSNMALVLDSTAGNRVTRAPITCLNTSSAAFTTSLWICRPTAISSTELMSCYGTTSNSGYDHYYSNGLATHVCFVGANLSNYLSVASTWAVGTWLHVTTVYKGSGTGNSGRLNLFLNGVKQAASYTGTIPATIPTDTTKTFILGTSGAAGEQNGYYDDVKVYSRALSDSEATALYFESLAGHPSLLNYVRTPRKVTTATGNRRRRVICGGIV